MKTKSLYLSACLIALTAVVALFAQQPTGNATNATTDSFTIYVKDGEYLSKIAYDLCGNQGVWRQAKAMSPNLRNSPEIPLPNGKVNVLVKRGNPVTLPADACIPPEPDNPRYELANPTPVQTAVADVCPNIEGIQTAVPADLVKVAGLCIPDRTPATEPTTSAKFGMFVGSVLSSPWFWLLLLLLALALYAAYKWLRRDPTRVGNGRVVENGITEPRQAAEHFQETLGLEFHVTPTAVRIINIVRGRSWGFARVIDRMGGWFRRLLDGTPTWEATGVLPNGERVTRYSLIPCANDVRGGGGMVPGFGFRFVADENVTDQIRPEPAAQTPAPQAAAAAAGAQNAPTTRQDTATQPVVPAPAEPAAAVVPQPPISTPSGQTTARGESAPKSGPAAESADEETAGWASFMKAHGRQPNRLEFEGFTGAEVTRDGRKTVIKLFE